MRNKKDNKSMYEQQEDFLRVQSDAFITLLTKRGILGDHQIDDEKIEAFDFLRLFYAAVGTNQIIDFNIIKNINIVMFDKIFCSLSRRSLTNFNGFSLTGEQLIAKMALINQVYYNALISGNPSKVTRFLFDIMKAYNSVQEKEKVRDLYNAVVKTAMTDLSINKTKIYKRRGL